MRPLLLTEWSVSHPRLVIVLTVILTVAFAAEVAFTGANLPSGTMTLGIAQD